MSDFGTRLKNIRKLKKMTQKELAEMLNVTQSTIANYESNLRFPGEANLKEISDLLHISTDYLLGIAEETKTVKPSGVVNLLNLKEDLLEALLNGDESIATKLVIEAYVNGAATHEVIDQVFHPIMIETGLLWETGKLDISEEHFISGVVERLISLIGVQLSDEDSQKSVILISPSGEEHVLVLKMIKEIFLEEGWRVFNLGKSIPVRSIAFLIEKENIDLIAISITGKNNLNGAEHLISAIRNLGFDKIPKIMVGGQALASEVHAKSFLGADYYADTFSELRKIALEQF
ncbi:MAG: helix-turn-helix domain-containing protein [Clostridiales bacterium]|nr:helix-turn-helix domain-containing protein [Clostridiales bacterium]